VATDFRIEERYEASASALIELYSDPRFHEDKAKHMGFARAHAVRREQPDGTLELSIQTMRPASWAPGGKDSSTFTLRIDPTTGDGTWDRVQHGFEDKADARGTQRIVADGDRASLVQVEGRLDIKIPMLGGMIEKKIIAAMESESEREADFVRSRLPND
jgi:hypothetical protein